VRTRLAFGIAILVAVLISPIPASAQQSNGPVLGASDLPAGWNVEGSGPVGTTPPCIKTAEAPLKSFAQRSAAYAGGAHQLASLTEQIVTVPQSHLNRTYSEVIRGYAACNGATWTRGVRLRLSVTRRIVPSVGAVHVTGFSIAIRSPSKNVDPNPYPGLVDFAEVGHRVVILSMLFADIPVSHSTFDSFETKAISMAA